MSSIDLSPPSGRYLSFAEREEIALLRAQDVGIREIARVIGRSASTVSRELRRNAATRGGRLEYRASIAQWKADLVARRPKTAKLVDNEKLRDYVQQKLAGEVHDADGKALGPQMTQWKGRNKPHRGDRRWSSAWSPEQISNRLKVDFPEDESMRISHEAIYQSLFIEGRGALERKLVACLRTGRALRVPRARTQRKPGGHVTDDVVLSQRPTEVEDRAAPGHWEGDLIIGLDRSAIGTVVERKTRFTMLIHLPRMAGYGIEPRVKNGPALAGYGAEAMREALAEQMSGLPLILRQSLTWDRGAGSVDWHDADAGFGEKALSLMFGHFGHKVISSFSVSGSTSAFAFDALVAAHKVGRSHNNPVSAGLICLGCRALVLDSRFGGLRGSVSRLLVCMLMCDGVAISQLRRRVEVGLGTRTHAGMSCTRHEGESRCPTSTM